MTKSTLTIGKNGILIWRNEKGQPHRDNDKPAFIEPDGAKYWYLNGRLHRNNDKPASIYSSGHKEWWVNGKFIRDSDDYIDFKN